jgi:transglutaminase-like putative cysteine protease
MRIAVTHSTIYRYDRPVFQEPHTFRLRPRSDASQTLLTHTLEISPEPAGRTTCLDQDGNVVIEAWFHDPMDELVVQSSFEVKTLRTNPFDFLFSGSELREPLRSALTPYLGATQSQAVLDFVRPIAGAEPLDFLRELNRMIFEGFAYEVRDHGPAEPPDRTLAARSGSCRDMAVLFCAACRSVGIPARFVSGYQAAEHERPDMHAWAEVYLQGGGWRGYDPSQGLAIADSHVAVAAAADPRLAAPVSGTYRGSANARMEFRIEIQAS